MARSTTRRSAAANKSPHNPDIDPGVVLRARAEQTLQDVFGVVSSAAGYRAKVRNSEQGGILTSVEEIDVMPFGSGEPCVVLIHREGQIGLPKRPIRAVTLFRPTDGADPSKLVMDGRAGKRDTILPWSKSFCVIPAGYTHADAVMVEADEQAVNDFIDLAEQLSESALVVVGTNETTPE